MRVAVIFDSFGPYHVARLTAAAALLDVVAIEVAASSVDYAWRRPDFGTAFERVTLFDSPSVGQPAREIVVRVEAALARFAPDVVAIPGWSDRAGLAALRWAGRNGVPVIVMSESNRDDEPRFAMREWVKRAILRQASAALAGGTRATEYLHALGMPLDRIATGYDVVDNDHFARGAEAARADADAVRARYGLPERYFLCNCRFVAKKNLPFVIDAYADYRRRAGDAAWSLVLSGDGDLKPVLEARAAGLKLGDSVRFPGFVQYEALPAYYGLAGGFILASTLEQWGLVVNEAMASGLPVLASRRCGSATDLVIDGRNGLRFDPADRGALVAAMEAIAAGDGTMGRESSTIIADWTPARFASGLAAMAAMAQASPLPRSTLVGRLALDLILK